MITYLVPVFNEEENLLRIAPELLPVIKKIGKFEILIVDDGSIDKSREIEDELSKKHKEIVVVKHKKNRGLGAAVRTGINHANGDLLIALDADFTFHPNEIPKLIEAHEKTNADCVIGSHFLKGGNFEKVLTHRVFLSKAVNKVYQILMGKKIASISSIFRLYRTDCLKKMPIVSTGFDINAEILFKLIKAKRKIIEVPATLTTRIHGESKINTAREIKNHIKLILKILYWRIK